MNVVFRVDASLNIGNGHVMRCLTLAQGLKNKGAVCSFICRPLPGNLINYIKQCEFHVYCLPVLGEYNFTDKENERDIYSKWLGVDVAIDAQQTRDVISRKNLQKKIDWLVVDHYAINEIWEEIAGLRVQHILVIDDLANRSHACEILLDQTYGRQSADYQKYVKKSSTLLVGSDFALLRSEFLEYRNASLRYRENPKIKNILITLGGVDGDNITGEVIKSLTQCPLCDDVRITVVMGQNAPWLEDVRMLGKQLQWPTSIKINVKNMAQLMSSHDLCIGAAGSTSWERCCLGLPTISIQIADNQDLITQNLEKAKAVISISDIATLKDTLPKIIDNLDNNLGLLSELSQNARALVDGRGTNRVVEKMYQLR